MRDLLNDLSEGLSHPDPILRAQIQMQKPLPKRFYKDVTVGEVEEGGLPSFSMASRCARPPRSR